MNKLSHIIIGAGRSGTTTLVEYLQQHPEICNSSIKEVPYFTIDEKYRQGESFLEAFFSKKDTFKIFSTCDTYLHINEEALQRIKAYNPDIKLTFLLRNPISRAYSNYWYAVNNGYQSASISFVDSEKMEEKIIYKNNTVDIDNLCHFYTSKYYGQIKTILKYFDKSQLFIATTDELKQNPNNLLNRLFGFLNVSEMTINPINAKNKSSLIRYKELNAILTNPQNPIRKLLSPFIKVPFIKQIVFKSNLVDKVHSLNKQEINVPEMSKVEIDFCKNYFKQDLELLEKDFGIRFTQL